MTQVPPGIPAADGAPDLLRHTTAKLGKAQLMAVHARMRALRAAQLVPAGLEALPVGCGQALREDDLAHGGDRRLPPASLPPGLACHLAADGPAALGRATGLALADRLHDRDRSHLVVLEEAASARGETHEAMALAARHNLPLLVLLEEDQRPARGGSAAMAAPGRRPEPERGWGIRGERVDGTDALALCHAATRALRRVRAGDGPVLLVAQSFRLDQPMLARDGSELPARLQAWWVRRDPLARLGAYLLQQKLADEAELGQPPRARAAEGRA